MCRHIFTIAVLIFFFYISIFCVCERVCLSTHVRAQVWRADNNPVGSC